MKAFSAMTRNDYAMFAGAEMFETVYGMWDRMPIIAFVHAEVRVDGCCDKFDVEVAAVVDANGLTLNACTDEGYALYTIPQPMSRDLAETLTVDELKEIASSTLFEEA